jgi:Gram-negative bacterial TonB protein C-terminal
MVLRTLGSLDQRALEAVRQWRFQPAMKGGQPMPFDGTVEVEFRLMDPVAPDSGFRSFARHQYERAIDSINFNLALSQKYSNEIEQLRRGQADETRRVMLEKDVERLSNEIKTASDRLPVLEYRLAHADDCARVYLEVARKTALTISDSSLVQLCQSADLYPPPK